MDFKTVLEKVKKSEGFSKFIKENPNSFLCAGFFVMDSISGQNTWEIDYFLPYKDKIATFVLSGNQVLGKLDNKMVYKNRKPEKIVDEIKFDFLELKKMIEQKINDKKRKLQKIIAILQNSQGNTIWNVTCMLDTMGMLSLKVDALNGKILHENFGSIFDIIQFKKDGK